MTSASQMRVPEGREGGEGAHTWGPQSYVISTLILSAAGGWHTDLEHGVLGLYPQVGVHVLSVSLKPVPASQGPPNSQDTQGQEGLWKARAPRLTGEGELRSEGGFSPRVERLSRVPPAPSRACNTGHTSDPRGWGAPPPSNPVTPAGCLQFKRHSLF